MAVNRRALAVAAVTLVAGLSLFRWGSGPVRGLGGDALIVVLLVALLAMVRVGTSWKRVAAVLGFAFAAEAFQGLGLVGADSHWFWHLTLGSTFDPVDLLSYLLGGAVAVGLERWWTASITPFEASSGSSSAPSP